MKAYKPTCIYYMCALYCRNSVNHAIACFVKKTNTNEHKFLSCILYMTCEVLLSYSLIQIYVLCELAVQQKQFYEQFLDECNISVHKSCILKTRLYTVQVAKYHSSVM